MKYMIVTQTFPPRTGGMQNVMDSISKRLSVSNETHIFPDHYLSKEYSSKNLNIHIHNNFSPKIFRPFIKKFLLKSNVKTLALNEDLYPSGDITSGLIRKNKIIEAKLISNQDAIIGGLLFVKYTFSLIDKKIKFIVKTKDGSFVKRNSTIAIIRGNKKNILVAERVALNFLSHISGIATKTNQFVKLVGKKCKICCTRKTIPNLRVIQKYAVKLGGGTNHRFNLSDEFLIKRQSYCKFKHKGNW